MAKAILIMDMPDRCNDCYAVHMSQSGKFCRAAKEHLQPKAKRPDWCPLLELPEKVAVAMTENEVIKICNTIIFAASMSLSNPQGTPLNMTKEELVEAMGMAIKAIEEVQQYRATGTQEECRTAMEKQHADKPLHQGYVYVCPSCNSQVTMGSKFIRPGTKFCEDCGQKLDWSDVE